MLTALKEDENQKTLRLKNKIQEITNLRGSLLSTISVVRHKLQSDDIQLIKVSIHNFLLFLFTTFVYFLCIYFLLVFHIKFHMQTKMHNS